MKRCFARRHGIKAQAWRHWAVRYIPGLVRQIGNAQALLCHREIGSMFA